MGFTGAWGGGAVPWQSPLQGVKLTLVSVLGSWVRLQSSAQLISSVCALVSGFRGLQARSELWPCAHVLR